jgi:hypothetical protein
MLLIFDADTDGDMPHLLYGITAELWRWVCQLGAPLANRALFRPGVKKRDLLRALAARDPLERRQQSIELIRKLWYSFPELGPYPLLETLDVREREGLFYREYRDHAAHQLMVYILGLYIYHQCRPIRHAIHEELGGQAGSDETENRFIRRWLAASIVHDVGYVFEMPEADHTTAGEGAQLFKEAKAALNHLLDCPLTDIPECNNGISRVSEWEVEVAQALGLSPRGVPLPPAELPGLRKNGEDALLDLEHEATASSLGAQGTSALRKYYEIAHRNSPATQNRAGFHDHGISSALIFLSGWGAYAQRLKDLNDHWNTLPDTLRSGLGPIEDFVVKTRRLVEQDDTRSDVRAAAGAMALHNINMSIWETHAIEAFKNGLRCNDYHICLGPTQDDRHKPLPLAFLLALADTLQDWGRPRFRPALDQGRARQLRDHQFSLTIKDDQLRVFFGKDADEGKSYDSLVNRLKAFLAPTDIDRLVTINDEMRSSFEHADSISRYNPPTSKNPGGGFDHGERIRVLAGKDPGGGNEDTFYLPRCENTATDGKRLCNIRWNSVLTIAEFIRCGEALAYEQKVSASLKLLMDVLERSVDFRSTEIGKISAVLYELRVAIDAVWRSLSRTPRKEDEGRERPPLERLRDFLHMRTNGKPMQTEREAADRFLNELKRIDAALRQSGAPRAKFARLRENGALLDAAPSLRQCLVHLSTIGKARSEDTFSDVRSVVRERALKDLHATFADVVRAFPHVAPSHPYLSTWRGGSR